MGKGRTKTIPTQLPLEDIDRFMAQRFVITLNAADEVLPTRPIKVENENYPVKLNNKGRDFEMEISGLYRTSHTKEHMEGVVEAIEKAMLERKHTIIEFFQLEDETVRILIGPVPEERRAIVARR